MSRKYLFLAEFVVPSPAKPQTIVLRYTMIGLSCCSSITSPSPTFCHFFWCCKYLFITLSRASFSNCTVKVRQSLVSCPFVLWNSHHIVTSRPSILLVGTGNLSLAASCKSFKISFFGVLKLRRKVFALSTNYVFF